MTTAARGEGSPRRRGADQVLIGMGLLAAMGGLLAGMIAADSAMMAVALAGGLMLAVAIVLRPDVATLTTIAIIYSNAAVIAVRFHGLPFFVGAAVPLLLVVPVARDLIVRRLPVVAPPMFGWMLILLFIHLVSALFSMNVSTAWDAVVIYAIEGVGLYFLLINVLRTSELIRQATWVLLGVGAFVSILSIHQDFTGNYDSNYWGFAQPSDAAFRTGVTTLTGDVEQRRLAGSVGETNRFAQVMLMLVPLGIYRFIGERTRLLQVSAAAATGLITLGVVLTFSRGAAIGLVALVVALAVLRLVRWRHLIVLALAVVLVFVFFPQYWQRVATLTEVGALIDPDASRAEVGGAILSRTTEALAAALVIVDHPVIGVGPGQFPSYYEAYASLVGIRVIEGATRESHNLFLGLGAELGLTGLIVFLIIGLLTIRTILSARWRSIDRRPDLEMLTTPFALSLMTYFVTGMFLHLSFARFFWLILAVGTAAALVTLREVAADDGREAGAQGAYSQSV